jgi:hypothetical protein
VRVLPETETRLEIWLVTHPGLRHSARSRAVFDFLAERLAAAAPRLAGGADRAGAAGARSEPQASGVSRG